MPHSKTQLRRYSRTVPLVLASSLAIGCSQQTSTTTLRDNYGSLDDCVKDWGDAGKCQQVGGSGGSGVHGGSGIGYIGPSYAEGSRESTQRSTTGSAGGDHAVGRFSTSISRGGFGGSARGSGGG